MSVEYCTGTTFSIFSMTPSIHLIPLIFTLTPHFSYLVTYPSFLLPNLSFLNLHPTSLILNSSFLVTFPICTLSLLYDHSALLPQPLILNPQSTIILNPHPSSVITQSSSSSKGQTSNLKHQTSILHPPPFNPQP